MTAIKRAISALMVFAAFHSPVAMGAGKKLFVNRTGFNVSVVLTVRQKNDPNHDAGTRDFELSPHQRMHIEYGDSADIYLNAIKLHADIDGQRKGSDWRVLGIGSGLDRDLNTHNAIELLYDGHSFLLGPTQER